MARTMRAGVVLLIVLCLAAALLAGCDSSSTLRDAAVPATCFYRAAGALPDPSCTPGALDHRVTQRTIRSTICKSGWASSVRPPASVTEPWKFESMRRYGDSTVKGQAALYEYDHLIPIELGGATVQTNLWPERRAGADGSFAKDRVENRLKADVCSGLVKLAAARRAVRLDWRTAP